MDSLNNHNGIVHHNGNSQQQGAERQQVDREAHHVEEEEGTYQRYRHGNQRDERRAPVLQEDVDNDEHQDKGEHQRKDNLLNRSIEELCYVIVNLINHAWREELSLFFQLGLHLLGNIVSVRTGNLLYHTQHRWQVVILHRY